ncbi:condensation domain-containing protein [Streptomyces triticirhizae]|uniref:Uncharacterized protein n=1 Tax=Streptomyces triticirhizae TaxID=2483353 RepID=A0A3M2M199_9ACTN|nr:condensation domain-containing protein [Streptomyces triticirhizae]RMI43397.1 hypothetical protein EBN88_07550 [Streptomyces triticirhizae]
MTVDDLREVDIHPGGPLSVAQAEWWRAPVRDLSMAGLGLTGPLDEPALERALAALHVRHEGLRCVVRTSDDGPPRQRVLGVVNGSLDRVGPLPEGALTASARRLVGTADGPAGPGLRALLVRQAPQEHLLVLAAHPLWVDEWSWQILLRDLGEAYARESGLTTGPARPLPPGVREATARVARRQADGSWERHTAYWRDRLAEAPPTQPFPAGDGGRRGHGAVWEHRVNSETANGLSALGRRLGTADWLNLLLLYAWVAGPELGTDHPVVGVPAAGTRLLPGLADTVGRLNGMLPVPFRLDGGAGFAAAAMAAQELARRDFAHQELPYDLAAGPGRRTPAAFSMRYPLHEPPELPGLRTRLLHFDDPPAPFDVWLRARADADGLRLAWCFDPAAVGGERVAAMAETYGRLVGAVVREPDSPLDVLASAARAPGAGGEGGSRSGSGAVRVVPTRFRPGTPTVVVAPAPNGPADACASLAADLPPDVSVIGFRVDADPGGDVARLAAGAFAALPPSVLATGVVFAGWGDGGLVAQELARLATTRTRELAPVFVVDCEPGPKAGSARASLIRPAHRPVFHGGPLHLVLTRPARGETAWRPLTERLFVHLVGGTTPVPPQRRIADVLAEVARDQARGAPGDRNEPTTSRTRTPLGPYGSRNHRSVSDT